MQERLTRRRDGMIRDIYDGDAYLKWSRILDSKGYP